MNRVTQQLVTSWIVLVTIASAFLAALPATPAPGLTPVASATRGSSAPDVMSMPEIDPILARYLEGRPAAPDYIGKLSPTMQAFAATGQGTMRAVVATTDVGELGSTLRSLGVDTPVGSVPTSVEGLRAVVVEVPASVLIKIASLGHVLEIAPAVQAELVSAIDPDMPATIGEGPAPSLIEAGKGHHVPDAWALGYTGTGIRVAPMDSGTDFGHPDLQGTFARVEDPASPYFDPFFGLGWPMAFDPYSMEVYLFTGGAAQFPAATFSWYVDTTFETTADAVTGLIDTPFLGRVYNVSGIPSASGTYHIGLHPDRTLRFSSTWNYREFVGLLVTDAFFPGVYDTVYVDLDHDKNFFDDKPATIFSPEIWADYYDPATATWDNTTFLTGDGIADMSGGIVYFIGDGTNPIPYSDNIASWYGLPLPVPGSGDLVALQIGDVRTLGGGDHGTFVASSIVAQNVTGTVHGFAPDARLISVGNVYASGLLFYDMWRFVGEGYDSTPGTGDEAHIASASFGFSGTFNDGFDFASRWADLWSLVYADTAFIVSSGNGGHGFGTVTAPGTGWNVITVGASTSYNAALGAFEDAAHSTFGDVQPWSNRGPSTLGQVKPDVVTVGAWASGDGALNSFGGRTTPWLVWGGTSLSAPATAGILALVKEAFYDTFGPPMEGFLAKVFLMGGADNIHYDPLVMGAGLTNASASVLQASGMDGIVPIGLIGFPTSQWPAGDFRGTAYPAFPHLVYPGTNNTTTFFLGNVQFSGPKDVTVSDWWLQKTGSDSWTFTTANSAESAPDFLRPDYLFDLTGLVPPGTSLVKATVSFPFAQFDPETNYAFNSRWRVLLYDWKDYNGNGSYWNDANSNGVVNAGEMDATAGTEIQRFTYGYPSHTNIQAFVHDPLSRISDGLLLGIQHRTVSSSVPSTNLTVTVDYYAAADAPWLSASPASLTVPCCAPGAFAPIGLTADIPAGTPPGVLTGFVTVHNDTTGDVNIPVIVNVGAVGPSFGFGGDPSGASFYDNSRTFGGVDWTWRADAGDWRFYFMDIPDSTPIAPGDRLLVHTSWENVPTDLDTLILGPSLDDCFIYPTPCFTPSGLFGPYSLSAIGQSPYTCGTPCTGIWRFNTATGGAEEWVSAPLTTTGLHGIALHNVVYAGLGPSEVFTGEVGTFAATPNPWIAVTPNGTGVGLFNVSSSLGLPGLDVLAYGVAPPVLAFGLPISETTDYIETFSVAGAGFIDVSIDGSGNPPGTDLDLYLERWTGTLWAPVASGTTPAASEFVHVTRPVDGLYRVRVDGFAIPGGSGFFSMFRVVPEGSELTPMDVPASPIPGGMPANFNVSWDIDVGTFPGLYFGVVFVGPDAAPTTVEIISVFFLFDAQAPEVLATSPADGTSLNDQSPTITVDYVDPIVSAGISFVSFQLDGIDLSFFGSFNETRFTWSTPFDLGLGTHVANVTIFDGGGFVTWYEWSFTIDTSAPSLDVTSPAYTLTNVPSAAVAGTTEAGASVTVNGVSVPVSGAGAFSTTLTLSEGPNTITVIATDAAGNSASVTKSVTLDTAAPSLSVATPANGAILASGLVTVSGTTEVGVDLTVNGLRVAVGPTGAWAVDLAFADGLQVVSARAVDAAGNSATVTRTITVDTAAPSLTVLSPDVDLTNIATVTVSGTTEVGATVTVNGAAVTVDGAGAFTTTLSLTEGANTIVVVATDAAGNSASVTRSVTLDTAVPALTVSVPLAGAVIGSSSVTVSGTTDPGADVTVNGVQAAVSPTGAWSLEVGLAPPDGPHTITVRAVDAAGNEATLTRTVTLDTIAPTVAASLAGTLGDNGWYRSSVTVTLTGSDATSSVTSVEWRLNGTGAWNSQSGSSATVSLSADGTYLVEYRAIDQGGNVAVERAVTVRIDTAAPSVSVTTPANGAEVDNASVEFTGTVSDPDAVVLVGGAQILPDAAGNWRTVVALIPGGNSITVSAVDPAGNAAPTQTIVVTYLSPIPDIQQEITDNVNTISATGSNLSFALIAVLVVLVALQLILYRNLSGKVEAMRRGELPPPPPEMPPEPKGGP
jgi:hypothetical protein